MAGGHRPTLSCNALGIGGASRVEEFQDGFSDPYGMFGDRRARARADTGPGGRLQTKALETMSLDPDVKLSAVRAELVRQFHPIPMARPPEEQLGRVIAAYQFSRIAAWRD